MALKFHESPFHVTHTEEVASKMAMKMDLSIMLSHLIQEKKWTQGDAALNLGVSQPRISDLINAKLERFTIDAMFDMLDALGFKACWSMPSLTHASIDIQQVKPLSVES